MPALRRRNTDLARPSREWDLLSEFDDLRSELSRIFDRWPWEPLSISQDGLTAGYPVDMFEEDDKVVVNAELPGFTKDQIEVSAENGILRISAERKEEKPNGKTRLHERRYERVERMISLPASVSDQKAVAKLDNGLLHLELSKTDKAKAHQIPVT